MKRSMRRLRVLIVAYAFPPVGGVGVQRAAKLAKYLPEFGVHVSVLTVSNPSVPLTDDTYEDDLRTVTVHRARTLEPGYAVKKATWKAGAAGELAPSLRARIVKRGVGVARQLLVPDPQVLWLPGAAAKLSQVVSENDVVLITAPPFSQFLLGPLVRARGVAVVLDYRDEWITLRNSYEMLQGNVARVLGAPMERAVLRSAHAVVAATEAFRANLLTEFPFLDPVRVHTITNGFDPDDYPEALPEPPTDRMLVSYAGTIYKLNSARGLLGGVRRLHAREPELARLLRLQFMGRIVDTELDAFEGMEAFGVERLGYVPHGEVFDKLGASHMTVIIVEDAPGTRRILPAKTFELMHLGRPILTLAPEGELTGLVRDLRLGPVMHPHDEVAICSFLADELRAFRDRGGRVRQSDMRRVGIARYHRRALAEQFARVLHQAAGRAR